MSRAGKKSIRNSTSLIMDEIEGLLYPICHLPGSNALLISGFFSGFRI